jgi:hypothetical protein
VVTPVSRAGKALNDFLLGRPARPAKELLLQVFAVAMRRLLAREPGPHAVANHVMEAFARLGIEPDERTVQKGIRLVGAALGRIEAKDRDVCLAGSLLIDLVRARGMAEAEIGALVAAGERRFKRWWRRCEPPSVPLGADGKSPRTIAGHRLKALTLRDKRAIRALPEDPSPECAQAVIDNAFFIAVRERFGEKPEPEHITLLARSIAAADVESLVLAEYADGDPPQAKAATETKVTVFAKIADDLGLYDHEIDDLIAMAESMAAEDGCALSLWKREEQHGGP